MKENGIRIDKTAKDKEWGFTAASRPRFIAGSDVGALICHGFGGTPANMRCLIDAAAELGLTAAAPLLSGHAATMGDMQKHGWLDWRDDVDSAYDKLVSSGCREIYLCGLSMGALLMADLAARRCAEGRIKGVVMICPPVKMKAYLNFSARALWPFAPYVLTADSFRPDPDAEMYYGMATKKLNDIIGLSTAVKKHAAEITVPVTLIEAGRDNRVDPVSYRILQKKLADCEHTVIEDAPHGIPYSAEADKLVEIFKEYLARRLKLHDKNDPTGGK